MRRLKKSLENSCPAAGILRRRESREAGFTLLETIIAMAIMVLALASILSVESNSINASARARQMNIVAMLAKDKMVETEYAIEGKTFDEVKKEEGGSFDAPYQEIRWKTTIKELEFPNLAVTGRKSEGGSGGGTTDAAETLTKLLTKFFSKAMREVTVTVIWTRGTGEQSFSLSTYWVNLNHEFELTE